MAEACLTCSKPTWSGQIGYISNKKINARPSRSLFRYCRFCNNALDKGSDRHEYSLAPTKSYSGENLAKICDQSITEISDNLFFGNIGPVSSYDILSIVAYFIHHLSENYRWRKISEHVSIETGLPYSLSRWQHNWNIDSILHRECLMTAVSWLLLLPVEQIIEINENNDRVIFPGRKIIGQADWIIGGAYPHWMKHIFPLDYRKQLLPGVSV